MCHDKVPITDTLVSLFHPHGLTPLSCRLDHSGSEHKRKVHNVERHQMLPGELTQILSDQ